MEKVRDLTPLEKRYLLRIAAGVREARAALERFNKEYQNVVEDLGGVPDLSTGVIYAKVVDSDESVDDGGTDDE